MNSLSGRLIIAAILVLLGFMVATGIALERAFESSARQAVRDRLQGLTYALLGAADVSDRGGFQVEERFIPDERLSQRESGLSALVLSEDGRVLWKSTSAVGVLALPAAPGVGEWLFTKTSGERASFLSAFGLQWGLDEPEIRRYVLLVIEDTEAYDRQLENFRRTLFTWLLGAAIGLLLVQLAVLRWGFSPLRRLTRGIKEIEAGNKESLTGRYPDELSPLVDGLNGLLRHERSRQTRIRNSLDDLAHSAKTPLAVLRGFVDQGELSASNRVKLADQLDRLDEIVRYQLRRAAARGRPGFLKPQELVPVLDRLSQALNKVYRQKQVGFVKEMAAGLALNADAGDLMELLGNLLDNAYKWCRSKVQVCAVKQGETLRLSVEDDGPGFPEDFSPSLMERGARADSRVEGQGIGLAVAAEIMNAYGGNIHLGRSQLGGARVSVEFPVD